MHIFAEVRLFVLLHRSAGSIFLFARGCLRKNYKKNIEYLENRFDLR